MFKKFRLGDIVSNQDFPWAEWMVFKVSEKEMSLVKTNGNDEIKHVTSEKNWFVRNKCIGYTIPWKFTATKKCSKN